ncbi:MAG TPA: hypothetical protein VJ837_01325 [Candidatus Paceibacterota bacterium]|nr:hypothetical protein [Candidatus Paceibacterota bacterium]
MERLRAQLPFTARVNVPDTVRGAELEIAFAAKDPDATLQQTERAFSKFVSAAEAGMLSGDGAPPSESRFHIVSSDRSGREARYRCTVRGIDLGGFRVLLNVAAEISRRVEPLEAVTIWGAAGGQGSSVEEILHRRYPGRAKVVPFDLILSEFFFENREPLVRMEFRRQVSDEQFDQIKVMMDAWDYVLSFGGYLDPASREGDILPEPGEFYLAEPLVLEHLIYAYQGPEESFNAVINMAVKLHHSGHRLSALEIE